MNQEVARLHALGKPLVGVGGPIEGVRTITVEGKTPGGRSILRRLALDADVLLTNLGPGAIDRLGLGYSDLVDENPRLIHCNVSGYGLSGPYRDVKAYDLLIQGEAGVIATTALPRCPRQSRHTDHGRCRWDCMPPLRLSPRSISVSGPAVAN